MCQFAERRTPFYTIFTPVFLDDHAKETASVLEYLYIALVFSH